MRIISGLARGLRLSTPPKKSLSIRPTSDKCREALFSILAERVVDAHILDLYAGTGALGLEALSRGAGSAVFIDNNTAALKLIRANIDLYKNSVHQGSPLPETSVVRYDLSKGIPSTPPGSGKMPFNIIFLDPPYDKGLALQTLQQLDNSILPAMDTILVAEERSRVKLPVIFKQFQLWDSRKYGDTGLWFYRGRSSS